MKKNFLLIFICIFMISCKGKVTENKRTHYQEIIDGPANFRDKINGKLIFELNDSIGVQITDFRKEWCEAGLFIGISETEYRNGQLNPNRKIKNSRNKTIGITKDSVDIVFDGEEDGKYFGFIAGFTHKNNIKEKYLLEKELESYINNNSRKKSDFDFFINNFDLELKESFLNYESYFKYENWITDPSPGFRILLLFEESELKGVLHSRSLKLKKSNTSKVNDIYKVTFFDDYPKGKQDNFISSIKEWLNGVD
ncbi:hypothetical protein HNV10_16785 [Winogradskyella litoriviva]|uniref:Lipoprotein n=1 Tax=Winogradskyella litoriviva TaxID=1220182 RepID=A0ABX2E8S1_9FLAO|nr:hypothetical protein [Winogradskyella litoriviva]NRD24913.1 hypothetical protein [Winogradskyella litoriviva]